MMTTCKASCQACNTYVVGDSGTYEYLTLGPPAQPSWERIRRAIHQAADNEDDIEEAKKTAKEDEKEKNFDPQEKLHIIMPVVGFGTAGLGDDTAKLVTAAIKKGYTLIDTADVSPARRTWGRAWACVGAGRTREEGSRGCARHRSRWRAWRRLLEGVRRQVALSHPVPHARATRLSVDPAPLRPPSAPSPGARVVPPGPGRRGREGLQGGARDTVPGLQGAPTRLWPRQAARGARPNPAGAADGLRGPAAAALPALLRRDRMPRGRKRKRGGADEGGRAVLVLAGGGAAARAGRGGRACGAAGRIAPPRARPGADGCGCQTPLAPLSPSPPHQNALWQETWKEMEKIRAEGKARAIGGRCERTPRPLLQLAPPPFRSPSTPVETVRPNHHVD